MSLSEATVAGRRALLGSTRFRVTLASRVLGLTALLAFAALLAVGLSHVRLSAHVPLSPTVAGLGCIGVITLLTLVVARYELAVGLGFLLFAIVLAQPAPTDIVFTFVMLVAAVTGRFQLRRLPRAPIWIIGALLVVNVLSLVDVISWSSAGRFFVTTLYLAMFGLWLAGYVDRRSRARRLVQIYLFIAVVSAALGTLALLAHFPGSVTFIAYGSRVKALFKDPNVFGPFLVPIAVILAEELLSRRLLRMRRSLLLGSFLILTLGIVFSYSRAAWLNYAVAMIVLLGIIVIRRLDRRAIALVTVLIVGGLAVSGVVVASGSLAFVQERAQAQGYDTSRFAAQAEGVKLGLHHLFGVGPGQFDVISPISTHSLYVRLLAEQGVVGLALLVAFIVATLSFGLLNVLRGTDTYGISAAALFAAWCGLIVNSFFIDTLHWRHLWLVAALIWAGTARWRRTLQSPPHRLGVTAIGAPPLPEPTPATTLG